MSETKTPLARRAVLGGAAAAGAAATVASLIPAAPQPAAPVGGAATAEADQPKGYQLTEHVKRYYATARV